MKEKISATIDERLVDYLDSLAGKNRSRKLEHVLRTFKEYEEDRQLRQELEAYEWTEEERLEQAAWERLSAEAAWRD